MPGSTIMVAFVPTMIPTFGTRGTDSLGMTYTCGEILRVVPSFTTGHSFSPVGGRVVSKTSAAWTVLNARRQPIRAVRRKDFICVFYQRCIIRLQADASAQLL